MIRWNLLSPIPELLSWLKPYLGCIVCWNSFLWASVEPNHFLLYFCEKMHSEFWAHKWGDVYILFHYSRRWFLDNYKLRIQHISKLDLQMWKEWLVRNLMLFMWDFSSKYMHFPTWVSWLYYWFAAVRF